ncbi:hypothetical protein [Streptomyces olivochromogenes]|uniref:Integral membrane protein n=1 Tax=Streptomyces olivochromogenes TaxID=1963 RepID=A0A250V6Y2_STROL|nr:hypothetical protein [Streptomyces olivochromogenes]KUN48347.1 hypothetical protein AQJ27_06100 [Streptomyces olivochromogenes]GAX49854.1 hypothetical protein SO3561_01343 [Streptomyces olivochromogenes]
MRAAVIVSKAVLVVLGTWVVLVVGLGLVALLPDRVQYYAISPLTMFLWVCALVVCPVISCLVLRRWIRTVPGMPKRDP